tara:strand:- start:4 stop:357 length:354 start_codon:yes stop_codon:yes gene_type:complete
MSSPTPPPSLEAAPPPSPSSPSSPPPDSAEDWATYNKLYVNKLPVETWRDAYTLAADACDVLDDPTSELNPELRRELGLLSTACFDAARDNNGPYSPAECETFARLQFLLLHLMGLA